MATLGVDADPSSLDPVPALVRSTHHADDRPAPPGELRSELVTVLADDGPGRVLVRLPRRGAPRRHVLAAARGRRPGARGVEAFLGGAVLGTGSGAGAPRVPVSPTGRGPPRAARGLGAARGAAGGAPAPASRTRWAGAPGTTTSTPSPRRTCAANLAPRRGLALRRVPARRRLPGGHRRLADHQRQVPVAGRRRWPRPSPPRAARPGIWIAPFLARPDSRGGARRTRTGSRRHAPSGTAARRHVATRPGVAPIHMLDTTHPEVARPPRGRRPRRWSTPASPT